MSMKKGRKLNHIVFQKVEKPYQWSYWLSPLFKPLCTGGTLQSFTCCNLTPGRVARLIAFSISWVSGSTCTLPHHHPISFFKHKHGNTVCRAECHVPRHGLHRTSVLQIRHKHVDRTATQLGGHQHLYTHICLLYNATKMLAKKADSRKNT
jgi:hypothetical protein